MGALMSHAFCLHPLLQPLLGLTLGLATCLASASGALASLTSRGWISTFKRVLLEGGYCAVRKPRLPCKRDTMWEA